MVRVLIGDEREEGGKKKQIMVARSDWREGLAYGEIKAPLREERIRVRFGA